MAIVMARSALLVAPVMLGLSFLLQGCFEPQAPPPQIPCPAVYVEGLRWAYVPSLIPGESWSADCIYPGFEGPKTAIVTCNGATGMLEPQPLPVCKQIPDWCKAESKDGYTIPSAGYREKVEVHCLDDSLEPVPAETFCVVNKTFFPIPRCVKPRDTPTTPTASSFAGVVCPANVFPPVPATAAGESASVTCTDHDGTLRAVSPTVTCTETGSFEPEPKCEPIPDYCLGKSTGTGGLKYSAAALGYNVSVECVEDGYVPKNAIASCGLHGIFSPKPECEKQGRRMSALRGGA